jgi:protein-tyrosine kinase
MEEERGGKDEDLPIVYTHTQTTQVSKKLLREHRIIAGFESGAFVDAYKMLRTQVLRQLENHGWNAVAVTSPGEHEGKTVTAINLAISLAMELSYTVLLVDADLRHPSIHQYFGLEQRAGLSDYLTGHVNLKNLLINPGNIERFIFLPGGKPMGNSSEMLSSPRMGQLVEDLKTRYPRRVIIFDLPSVLTASDAIAFTRHADASLVVVEDDKTEADDLARAISLLSTNTHILGTVLNKTNSHVMREDR